MNFVVVCCFRLSPVLGLVCVFSMLGLTGDLSAEELRDLQDAHLQHPENPPMQVVAEPTPALPETDGEFEVREGFQLIASLQEFREAIKQDNQKIRLKPGVYRAESVDPPVTFREVLPLPGSSERREHEQHHVFCVSGSGNHFDLRGVVIETPISLNAQLSSKAHVADTWHINGSHNVFEGGYFRNVVDRQYPDFRTTECEFEVCNDHTTFLNCTFDIRGSIPFGYTDYYGKGGPNFGRLAKHSFMGIINCSYTALIGCRVYQQAFGHGVHLHNVDGVLIRDCYLSGALRPTNDIFKETAGRAVEYDFMAKYRGDRPIPKDRMIPLVEDGIRAYNDVRNVLVENTEIRRFRGCVQLLCTGDVMLRNVTVREAGDFSFDVSSLPGFEVKMEQCASDYAYSPIFNLTRGETPQNATYELKVLPNSVDVVPLERGRLGLLSGKGCRFLITADEEAGDLSQLTPVECGDRHPLENCMLSNFTDIPVLLTKRASGCTVRSRGVVTDNGSGNRVARRR